MKRMLKKQTKIMLHACPRCQGDLFPDEYEEDFACLQCGRRFTAAAIAAMKAGEAETEKELAQAA